MVCVLGSSIVYDLNHFGKHSHKKSNSISDTEILGCVRLFAWCWIMLWYEGNAVVTMSNLHLLANSQELQSMQYDIEI